jgi:hypothetical protein
METFEKIQQLLDQVRPDLQKFLEKENSSAGTRVRKSMQDLKGLAQELRLEVQNSKKESDATEK